MFIEEQDTRCIDRIVSESDESVINNDVLYSHDDGMHLANSFIEDSSKDFKYFQHDNLNEDENSNNLCALTAYPPSYRKPCNCAKSHCLKLYCECFARGSACDNCNCTNCMNNSLHDGDRRRAIKLTLERNPLAFHPKIGEGDRRHSKGCNCKRSSCLKNYCECYEAKINCSDLCRCQGCRNFDENRTPGALQLPSGNVSRQKSAMNQKNPCFMYDQNAVCFKDDFIKLPHANQAFSRLLGLPIQNIPYDYFYEEPLIPSGFLTHEVAEAACSCMLAQLSEARQRDAHLIDQERIVLEEFGRCLEQILESAAKLRNVPCEITPDVQFCESMHNPDFITVLPSVQDSFETNEDSNLNPQIRFTESNDISCENEIQGYQTEQYVQDNMNSTNSCEKEQLDYSQVKCCPNSLDQVSDSYAEQSAEINLSYVNSLISNTNTKSHSQPVIRIYNLTSDPENHYLSISNNIEVDQPHDTGYSVNPRNAGVDPQLICTGFQISDGKESFVENNEGPREELSNNYSSIQSSNYDEKSHLEYTPNPINATISDCSVDVGNRLISSVDLHGNVGQEVNTDNNDEEEEESHTATAALLNASFHYEDNHFNFSSEIDFIGLGEPNSSLSIGKNIITNDNQISNQTVKELNSILLSTNQKLDVNCSQLNHFQISKQNQNDISFKNELEFYNAL